MNNAKMWLVVKPTVGVPLFLSAVAVGSFAVHVAVLSNTSWVDDFLQGVPMGTGDQAALELKQGDMETAKVSYVRPTDKGLEVTLVMPDGTSATGVLQTGEIQASAQLDTLPKVISQ